MSTWNHYLITGDEPFSIHEAERALQAADPDFYIDGDVIVLRNGYGDDGEELECGQITVTLCADPASLPDRRFFLEQMEGKANRERLLAVLDGVRSQVSVQLINTDFWWDNEPKRTLRPLQDWLRTRYEGVLWVEGGEFYDRRGRVR